MAAITPSQRIDNVNGSVREIYAKFASVADTNTWATGLSSVYSLSVSSGASKVMYATASGGTITFAVTSGPDTNTYITVTGT